MNTPASRAPTRNDQPFFKRTSVRVDGKATDDGRSIVASIFELQCSTRTLLNRSEVLCMRPLRDVLALESARGIRKAEMDTLQYAGVFDFIPNLGQLRIGSRIDLGWARVRCRYLEIDLIRVEVQRYGARGRCHETVGARCEV